MNVNGFARGRWAAIAAGALVIALAACGSQPNSVTVKKQVAPSPQKVVLASVQATTAAKSARIAMTISADGTGSKAFGLTSDGVADFVTGDSDLTMKLNGAGADFFPGGIEVRTVDGASYTKLPESIGGIFGGAHWLKMPNFGAAGLVPGFDQSDPTQFLAYLETISNSVKKVGTESIRGVETTHYSAILDLAKAVNRSHVPASLKDALGKIFKKDGSSLTIPADVWVDNDGLARRIQLKLDLGKLADDSAAGNNADGASTMTMSMDLYDFGAPVHVAAPPASDTIDFNDFGKNVGGLFGPTGATGATGASGATGANGTLGAPA